MQTGVVVNMEHVHIPENLSYLPPTSKKDLNKDELNSINPYESFIIIHTSFMKIIAKLLSKNRISKNPSILVNGQYH